MESNTAYLPGTVRDRIQDLMKEKKLTQAQLAYQIGTAESTLSRFLSGKTDKLGDESIIQIARLFDVSTDFLLGETDAPDRKNYDLSELGLTVQAARNLYTGRVNPAVVSMLLENPRFSEATYLISRYLNDELAAGFAAQNQLYAMAAGLLSGIPRAKQEVLGLQTPIYQADLQEIQEKLMEAVRELKTETGKLAERSGRQVADAFSQVYQNLTKGQDKPLRTCTPEDVADAVAAAVSGLEGVDPDAVRQLALSVMPGRKLHDQ